MPVLIRDVVLEIQAYINQLSNQRPKGKLYVGMASELALHILNKLLQELGKVNDQEATLITLQPLISLLNDHGEEGEGFLSTNAIITNSPQSPINQVYWKIASILSRLFNVHPYDYILPTLRDSADKNEIYQLKPHQFVLTEDNLSAIDVAKCLNEAATKYRTTLRRTYGPDVELTQSEAERVISHSIQALYYYESIKAVIKYKSDAFKAGIEKAAKEFNVAIQSDHYEVRSTYGESGDKILISYIAKHTIDLRQLSDLVAKYLPKRSQWELFISQMYTADLNRIVQSDDSLTSIYMNYSEEHLRVAAFCRAEFYKRDRKHNPEKYETNLGQYKGWLGGDSGNANPKANEKPQASPEKKELARTTSSSWFGMYGKSLTDYSKQITKVATEYAGRYTEEQKLEAVQTYQEFLISNYGLDQWEQYLKDKKKEHCYYPLRSGTLWLLLTSEMEALVSTPKAKASLV